MSSRPARQLKRIRAEIGLPDDFEKRGPAARIECLAMAGDSPEKRNTLTNTSERLNIINQVDKPLASSRSGVH